MPEDLSRAACGKPSRIAMSVAALATAAATGGAVVPVAAHAATPPGIRQVACQGTTFDVFYAPNREICFEGTGEIAVRIGPVSRITSGINTGEFGIILHGTLDLLVPFTPGHTYSYPVADQAELTLVAITRA